MSLARAARWVAALAAAAAAGAAPAQVGPRPLALYPLARAESAPADVADVQALLDAALHRAAQRSDTVVVADPPLLRASCGPAATASRSCLAALAGSGLVLRATVHRSQQTLVVAIEAIDRLGRTFGPVSASVDAYVQNAAPLAQAVLLLADQLARAKPPTPAGSGPAQAVASAPVPLPPPPAGAAPAAPPPSAPAAEPPRAPAAPPVAAPPAVASAPPQSVRPADGEASPPPAPAPPAGEVDADEPAVAAASAPPRAPPPAPDLRAAPEPREAPSVAVAPPPGRSRTWMRGTGRWLTIAGAALVAGGAGVAVLNRSQSDELESRFRAGTLTPADLPKYDRVEQYDTISAILFASGGALTLSGVALWTAAPAPGRVVAGLSGRF